MVKRIISPSILSADFGNLRRDMLMLDRSEAQWIHVDVMDGVFVPNISFGFPVLKAVDSVTDKFMDVHLMIVNPERYVERFVESGADQVTVHIEAVDDLNGCIDLIHKAGAKAGVSVKPATDVATLFDYLDRLDFVLLMSVEPGFGGQKFIESTFDKIVELRHEIESRGLSTLIGIDGGVSRANAHALFQAGCNVLVAGNAVFKADDPQAEIMNILNA